MPGGRNNIRPEDNTNGFQKNPQNINRNGSKPSIKKQLAKILKSEGTLPLPKKFFIKEDNDNYYFEIPTQTMIALKLISISMGNKKDSFNAIKLLLETFDGKAVQSVLELNANDKHGNIIVQDNETKKMLEKLRDND